EGWDEASATWQSRMSGTPWSAEGAGPASRSPQPIAEFNPNHNNRDYTIRLPTDLVARWIATPAQNFGVVLVVEGTGDQGTTFVTREDPTAGNRPRLQLSYKKQDN